MAFSFRRLANKRRFGLLPLGPEMAGFCGWLRGQGFCHEVWRYRLWQVSHFNQYLRRLGVKDCREVERSFAERFIREHLPRCQCSGVQKSSRKGTAKSVRSLMDYLSERGLLAPPPSETPLPHETLLEEYLDHLRCERNLTDRTIKTRRRYLVPFLEDLGPDVAAERLHKLTPDQVQSFFAKYTDNVGHTTRRCIQGTLRTFFRFCVKEGYLKRDLTQAIPQLRIYKLSHVPRGVSDQDARKVLDSIDRTTVAGLRDFAIIQVLHTYGVRGYLPYLFSVL